MAVTSQTPQVQYTANGSTTNFAFTFVVPASDSGGTLTGTGIGNMTSGSAQLTVGSPGFLYTSDLQGKAITVTGAGPNSTPLVTTITTVTNDQIAQLADAASTTVTSQNFVITTGTFATTLNNNADIVVFVDGVQKTIGASNDYTVRLNVGDDSNKAGEVIFNSAPSASSKITIKRDVTLARTTDFQTGGALTAKTLNSEFDTMIMAIQDTQFETTEGAVKFPSDETPTSSFLPSATIRAGKVLAFDSGGELKVVDDLTEGSKNVIGVIGKFTTAVQTPKIQHPNVSADALTIATDGAITISQSLTAGTVDINGGAIDGTTIGAATPSTGVFTDLTASGTISLGSGAVDINAGTIDGAVIGGSSPAAITTTDLTATTADINGGSIDGTTIGGSSAAPVTATNLTASGTISLNSLTYPTSDGANEQVLSTDGSGNLSFRSIAGLSLFTALTDTPTSYSGAAGKYVKVNSSANGVEFDTLTTDDVTEGSNLYYTDARADARVNNAILDEDNFASNSATKVPSQQSTKAYIQSQIETKDNTDEITEGSTNLYFTNARADARFDVKMAAADTGDLAEGTNLYYTDARVDSRFDTRLLTKTTDHLAEGSINLYYTDARVQAISINSLVEDLSPQLGAPLDVLAQEIQSSNSNIVLNATGTDKEVQVKITDAGGTSKNAVEFRDYAYQENATDGDANSVATKYQGLVDIPGHGIRIGSSNNQFSSTGEAPNNNNADYATTGLLITNGDQDLWPMVDIVSYGGANPLLNKNGPSWAGGLATSFPNAAIQFKASSGTESNKSALTSGSRMGQLAFTGYDGSKFGGSSAIASATLTVTATETFSTSNARGAKVVLDVMKTGGSASDGDGTSDRIAGLELQGSALTINPDSKDLDFKVNGDTNTDIFVVDAGTEKTQIKNLQLSGDADSLTHKFTTTTTNGTIFFKPDHTGATGNYGPTGGWGWGGGKTHFNGPISITSDDTPDIGEIYNAGIQITASGDSYPAVVLAAKSDSDRFGNIWFLRSGADGSDARVSDGATLGGFFTSGFAAAGSGQDYNTVSASCFFVAAGDHSDSNSGAYFQVRSTNEDSTSQRTVVNFKGNRVHINPDNNNIDLRVDGDTNDNIFMVDAGNERVGIKTNSPSADLEVVGTFKCTSFDSSIGINTLGDVDTATNAPNDGEFLKYVAGSTNKWVPAAIGVGGTLASNLTTSKYVVGNFNNGFSSGSGNSGSEPPAGTTYNLHDNQGQTDKNLQLQAGNHYKAESSIGSGNSNAQWTGGVKVANSSFVEFGLSNTEHWTQFGSHSVPWGSNFRNSERNKASITFGLPFDQVLHGDRSGQINHLRRAVPTLKFKNRGVIDHAAKNLTLADGNGNNVTEQIRSESSLTINDFNYGGAITTEHAVSLEDGIEFEDYNGIAGVSKSGTGGLNIPNANDLLVGAYPVGDEFIDQDIDTAIVGDTVIMVGGKSNILSVASPSAGSSREPELWAMTRDQNRNRYLIEEAVRFESPSTGSLKYQTFTLSGAKSLPKNSYLVQANTNATARVKTSTTNSTSVVVYNVTGTWNTSDSVTWRDGQTGVLSSVGDFTPTNLGTETGSGITNGGGRATFGVPITFANKTTTQRDALTAAEGMMLYNSTTDQIELYNGSSWGALGGGNADNYFATSGLSAKDLGLGLHIKTADSGASVANEADELVVEGSGDAGMSILSGTGNTGSINFGDSGDNDIGRLVYNQDDNSMRIITNASERMRILSDGRICFGVTSQQQDGRFTMQGPFSTNRGLVLKTTENGGTAIYFDKQGSGAGYIQINTNNTVSYNTSSDYRLKENVDYDFDATTRLKQLKPARFSWKVDETNTLVDGFLAHEVSSVVPEAISGEKDAVKEDGTIIPQAIDQSKLVPLLVKTIQELEARIKTLEDNQ